MAKGIIKKWLANQARGWILDDADGAEVFFNQSAVQGLASTALNPGVAVEFERRGGTHGPYAVTVRLLSGPRVVSAPAKPSLPGGVRKLSPEPMANPQWEWPKTPISLEEVPVPESLLRRLDQKTFPLKERHPGLHLDKLLTPCVKQEQQRTVLQQVADMIGAPEILEEVHQRRLEVFSAGRHWSRTTAGPLTLHLARASALENAGLCLHPIYGFAYLPGTGLKGMARAYAETVWLPGQSDQTRALQDIQEVFGVAPRSQGSAAKDSEQNLSQAGRIVFHEGWPRTWPRLFVDIVNNHHPNYYQGKDAPGDWESPNPVYFLAVAPGTTFDFALALRRANDSERWLLLAQEWLDGALTRLGCGAKTAAGYGYFRPTGPLAPSSALIEFDLTMKLATPAFLAGAGQKEQDCDLRAATLRGLLRWWWRAMHVGFVDIATLRRLEAAIWGDTSTGGAVRLEIRPLGKTKAILFDRDREARYHKIPPPGRAKTTMGLTYHSYGMHDGGKQRYYVPEGTRWHLVLRVTDAFWIRQDPIISSKTSRQIIDKRRVLEQAKVALWWLTQLGGVGGKSHKGFGSFFSPDELEGFEGGRYKTKGREFRDACGTGFPDFDANHTKDAPSLLQMISLGRQLDPNCSGYLELTVPEQDVWRALDRVGRAAQEFAQEYKHRRVKCALGLPRKIGHPASGSFRPGPGVSDRHTSPIHYHLHGCNGGHCLRVAAFPAGRLPNLDESSQFLTELLRYYMGVFIA